MIVLSLGETEHGTLLLWNCSFILLYGTHGDTPAWKHQDVVRRVIAHIDHLAVPVDVSGFCRRVV